MATFLICHGAWSAGWAWKKMRPLLRAAGHEVFTPTYTGLGERVHQASPVRRPRDAHQGCAGRHRVRGPARRHPGGPQLRRHGRDRRGRPRARAHQAADLPRCLRAGERPERARSARACVHVRLPRRAKARTGSIPPNPPPPDTSPADLAWITPLRRPQPVKTFTQALRAAQSGAETPAQLHLLHQEGARRSVPAVLQALQVRSAWRYHEIDASHSPNVTAPEALAQAALRDRSLGASFPRSVSGSGNPAKNSAPADDI